MANTVVNPTIYANKTQMFLRSSLVGESIARSQFRADLHPGKTIDFPYATTSRIQNYSYSTDLTIDPTVSTSNTYAIDQVKAATANFDPLQNLVSNDMNIEDAVADEIGYQMARNIDQYILQTGITGALNTVAGGTLSASNMFETLTSVAATLARARARTGVRVAVLDPDRCAVLANTDKANGFNVADAALRNGFVGNTAAGFRVYMSNDLPYTVVMTVDTNPTAGDTFTIFGKTFTFRANGTAAVAGEISLGTGGSALADTVAIIRTAINGTGTPGASTYIDLATDDRRELLNAQITCSAFSANAATITCYGKMAPSETFTAATNVFGTETVSFLLGTMGAIDFTLQAAPDIEINKEPKNRSHNLIGTTQFGAGVFYRDKASLVKLTANA